MSLFEHPDYQWRETYFVLLHERDRPSAEQVKRSLQTLGNRCQLSDVRADDQGRFESLTIIAPNDFAAMDLTYVSGEDVTTQVADLIEELRHSTLSPQEMAKLTQLETCNARLEIYHFQQVLQGEDEEEFLDPGALLQVMQRLVRISHGIGVDPQSGALM